MAAEARPTDSTFLLLSSTNSTNSNPISYSIPRPRSLPILVIAALIDLAFSINTIVIELTDSIDQEIGIVVLLGWGLIRPLSVLYLLSSRRIREKSYAILGQLIVTCLVCLYYFNEVQQRRPDAPPISDPSTNSTLLISTLHSILPPFTTISTFIFTSLAFSSLHYLLFAIFIGIRRRHNPFVTRPRIGLPRTASRASYREEVWEGEAEEVGNESVNYRNSLYAGDVSDVEDGDEEEEDDTSSDEDEIIDIPKSAELRSRTSRGSLRQSVGREESTNRGSRIVSTNYGSFAGI